MKRLPFWRHDRFFKRAVSLIILFSLTVLGVSCTATSSSNPSQSATTPTINPVVTQPLRVAVIPARSSQEQENRLQSLAAYLQQILNRSVNIQLSKNYEAAVDLLVNEEVEMAYLGALTYIKARDRNPNIEPLVLPIEQITGRPWYTSVIIANSDREINSLQDLQGKRFAFVSPSSTSGFLMPMNAFQKKGIDPTRDFVGIRYSGSHDQAETDLETGVVDAIATEKAIFLQSRREGKLKSSNYKIIWESEPIPTTPIVINTKKFSPEVINQLKRALIDAPSGIVDVNGSNSNGYTVTKDADFEQIRQIYTRLKSVVVAAK
ncbi:phosphate/phosphite/phosphonate ABC transporter substrate-binding protein [Pelatocladus sp. BLCC-F211]|uniref:phosphate/phosphite/phosphonate ABC transporter substrate-binding protein n=1 Tax=Pelatocladus sp. BLCC-F211 TaxID=3342752 RepID=UPI0035B8B644